MNLSYKIKENGYEIYKDGVIWITQYEPYIPNRNLSYEENAIAQIEELRKPTENKDSVESKILSLEEELAKINYTLMMGGLI